MHTVTMALYVATSVVAFMLLLLTVSARGPEPSPTFCQREKPPLVCAHGGDNSDAHPNTLRAYKHAVLGGSLCLEVDVSITSDGHLVVAHNRDIGVLLETQEELELSTMSWSQIKDKKYPRGGSVPFFESILDFALESKMNHVVLDVKLPQTASIALIEKLGNSLMDLLNRKGCTRNCSTVWSKNDDFVRWYKKRQPDQPVGIIVGPAEEEPKETLDELMERSLRVPEAEVVGTNYQCLSDEYVDKLQRDMGKSVYAWTANTQGMARTALNSGAHVVISSFPRMVEGIIMGWENACRRKAHQPRVHPQHGGEGGRLRRRNRRNHMKARNPSMVT